jgi:hypothetical protein
MTMQAPLAPAPSPDNTAGLHFELRFDSLFNGGRGMTFPCDSAGRVFMDTLSERALSNYLYARAVVGREFSHPVVRPSDWH